jgi:hypothetical protein
MLELETQDIPVPGQFQADGVIEGGVPCDGLFFSGSGLFAADKSPSHTKYNAKKACPAMGKKGGQQFRLKYAGRIIRWDNPETRIPWDDSLSAK